MIWYYITLLILGMAIGAVPIIIKKNIRKAIEEGAWGRDLGLERAESWVLVLAWLCIMTSWTPTFTFAGRHDRKIEALEHKVDSLQKSIDLLNEPIKDTIFLHVLVKEID